MTNPEHDDDLMAIKHKPFVFNPETMEVVSKQKLPAYQCGYYIGSCECRCKDGSFCHNSGQYYIIVDRVLIAVCSLHKRTIEKGSSREIHPREKVIMDNPLYQHYYGDGRRMRGYDPNKRQILN